MAIKNDLPQLVTILISNKANVNVTDCHGLSPTFLAALNFDSDLFTELVEAGAEVEHVLHFDKSYNIRSLISILLPEYPQTNTLTLLSFATQKGLTEIVDLILTDVSEIRRIDEVGSTLIHDAISYNRYKTASLLIEKTTDINARNKFGETPLIYASKKNQIDIMKLILKYKPDVNAYDKSGVTALLVAIIKGHTDIAIALIEYPTTNINAKTNMGMTILLLTIDAGYENIAMKLIEMGADIHGKNRRGLTVLHLAISHDYFQITIRLIEAGASINAKEYRNNRPFDMFSSDSAKEQFFNQADFSLQALTSNNYELWFYLIQLSEDRLPGMQDCILHYVHRNPELARVKDVDGRVAMDVATKGNKAVIQSIYLWYGRYRVVEDRPEHNSDTCYVFKALDEGTKLKLYRNI